MAKDAKLAEEKLKRRLSGRLFRYTFAVSVAAHLGVWALVGWPGGHPSQGAAFGFHEYRMIIPADSYKKLPPPPSINPPEKPSPMPKGIPGKEGLGEVPIPAPDDDTIFSTIRDPHVDNGSSFIDPGQRITVETPGPAIEKPVSASPNHVEFVTTSKSPAIIYQSRPEYPDIARDSRVEGDVVLLVYIDERGDVRRAIVQSSPGLPAMDDAATKAAYKCKFEPAEQQGIPVGVWYSIVMEFRL